jgi:hypothetical protein
VRDQGVARGRGVRPTWACLRIVKNRRDRTLESAGQKKNHKNQNH